MVEEGSRCPDCGGEMHYGEVEGCYCHTAPPCSNCVDNPLTCKECGWQEGDKLVTDKRVFVDENELTLMIQAAVDGTIKETVRQRDLLWCKALTSCGMDPREMQQLLQKFNRIRPDKEQKYEAGYGGSPGESDPRLSSPPVGSGEAQSEGGLDNPEEDSTSEE